MELIEKLAPPTFMIEFTHVPAAAMSSHWKQLAVCGGRQLLSFRRLASTVSDVLQDRHNRSHTYLRISLTERCNLRCELFIPRHREL